MIVREIRFSLGDVGRSPAAHIEVDGVEYMILGGRSSVTILSGRWCHDRRATGKTFRSVADVVSHYKRHGEEIAKYVSRLVSF